MGHKRKSSGTTVGKRLVRFEDGTGHFEVEVEASPRMLQVLKTQWLTIVRDRNSYRSIEEMALDFLEHQTTVQWEVPHFFVLPVQGPNPK